MGKRGERPAGEVSAGGVIVDRGEALILRHARGEWIMPKGHLEPGETPEEAALREVREETGLEARIVAPLGETSYHYRREGETLLRPKKVIWYLMALGVPRENLALLTEEGLMEAAWLPLDEMAARLTWQGDKGIVEKARQALRALPDDSPFTASLRPFAP
ncbi:MAG: NUDIX hydrolase [Chitinophagales bacterium]